MGGRSRGQGREWKKEKVFFKKGKKKRKLKRERPKQTADYTVKWGEGKRGKKKKIEERERE